MSVGNEKMAQKVLSEDHGVKYRLLTRDSVYQIEITVKQLQHRLSLKHNYLQS